ncbi:MAG: hypothetical protein RL139_1224 [Gemmatimonadota bacterium]
MRKFVPFVAVAVLVAAAPVQAQNTCPINAAGSCNVTTTATMTMPTLARLTLSATSAALATPDSAGQFDANGEVKKQSNGPTLSVRANRTWNISVESVGASFGTAPSNVTKPASDVEWSIDGSSWTALGTTATQVTDGSATADLSPVQVYYRTKYVITNDKPGAHSLGIKYTLTANCGARCLRTLGP